MLIEAVSFGVPWTAQRHRTNMGYVQLHYELDGVAAGEISVGVHLSSAEVGYEDDCGRGPVAVVRFAGS